MSKTKAATELFNRFLLFARKKLAKTNKEGIMKIPNDEQAKALANETIAKFTTYKVPPSSLNTADDIAMIDNQINNIEQNKLVNEIKKNLTPKKDNVIDITDKMPNPFENLEAAKKAGNFKGIANQVLRDPDIAREFMLSKKFPTTVASGEDAIPIARRAKFDEEIPYKPLPDEEYTVEKIVKDFKKVGATDKDIQTILTSGKAGQIPYVMSNYGLSFKDVISTLKSGKPLIEGLATGGRAGFKSGSYLFEGAKKLGRKYKGSTLEAILENPKLLGTELGYEGLAEILRLIGFKEGGRIGYKDGPDQPSRRKFLKIAGGLAALPIIGKFFKPAKIASKAAPVIKKTISGAPSYFFDLVDKIKILGVRSKGFKERSESFRYKDYDMDIDYDTGDIQIKKTKEAMIPGGDEAGIAEESIMVYRPGRADELTKGKTPPDEYDEYTARPDMDGKMKDIDNGLSENVEKEIMEELDVGGGNLDELTLQEIKRGELASGGIARMLGE